VRAAWLASDAGKAYEAKRAYQRKRNDKCAEKKAKTIQAQSLNNEG